ncbi:hypothetical protein OG417_35090 [Actinoallomurus sp. NBC_01490]|jgi:hypothetical protein|uniref:hypothetical protein n=1 Tax=Actinoallomurus sp. NBC_01490 TaxID=2903557 RepID=UPI002E2F711F|nr:hypothetical protein [Actinoallomurus sp. NBC_01490]
MAKTREATSQPARPYLQARSFTREADRTTAADVGGHFYEHADLTEVRRIAEPDFITVADAREPRPADPAAARLTDRLSPG